jgi:hypothetical protein
MATVFFQMLWLHIPGESRGEFFDGGKKLFLPRKLQQFSAIISKIKDLRKRVEHFMFFLFF